MIKTLTHHYHKVSGAGKLALKIVFLLGIFFSTFKFVYADVLPFENSLPTMFSWLNTGYYSNAHFKFGGNNFVGILLWQTPETLSTPQQISMNNGAQAIQCTQKLRGIYYNNQRGRRIWPLDTANLATLSVQGSGYGSMTITNGFFTNCTALSGGYIPALNDVYGQIDHTIGTQTGFRMIAGINYDFANNTFSGTSFGHTLSITTGGIYTGFMFDTNGGIAELSMNVPWCQNFTSSPSTQPIIIGQGSGMTFTCYGSNITGYILGFIHAGSTTPFITYQAFTTNSSYTRTTGSSLATGDYIATCTVLGPTAVGPQCGTQIAFHVGITGTVTPPPVGTGCNPNFQGEITFSSLSGSTVINPGLGTYYTNKTGVTIQLAATEPTHFVVSGNFIGTPRVGDYLYNSIFTPILNPTIVLQSLNTFNNFGSIYSTGACTYTDAAKRIYVDTLAPTTPVLTTTNSTNLCPSFPITFTRTASTDSGAGIGYYKYELYNNNGMVTGMTLSGTVPNTVTSLPINISLLPLGTYYMRVQAVDAVGNSALSNVISFTSSQQYCASTSSGIVIVTPTIWLRNVDLDKVYRSDPIRILGLTGPTLISISKGMLFINNGTGIGTTGIVTSSDSIYIEVVSSDKYDTTVSSNLSVLGLNGTFSVTTKKSNCSLSTAEKLIIQNIYADLKDQYNNDISKYTDFLNTFQSMVKDESDLDGSCSLDYLLTLIEDDFGSNNGEIDTSNHITPNCKEYSIGYDNGQHAYYAPEMANRYYFINRESLIRHLDYYNPGDCHINTYGNNFRTQDTSDPMKHIAPNGKIYHLIGQYGGFSASEFVSPKYFDSLATIKMFIDLRNPPKEIWKHGIDISFTPIVFAAPNGKEYKIYKTDRGYMSYKLMKVRYYGTISELKNYININNPSKR